ncbi:hypothetical protein BU17DRAFT_60089 [Hysterangium stoloniferum]|nr:hypothetical protein BU17DRAFT_60089 [Hysterangium stoloniferum]
MFARSSTEPQVAYSSNNRISTSGTCLHMPFGSALTFGFTGCFSVDRMSPRFAFGVLPLLIYETIVCFLVLWKAIQNSEDGMGLHFYQEWYMTAFYPIDRLPAHPREVKITIVTPALDEFYRFHCVIVEQIVQ